MLPPRIGDIWRDTDGEHSLIVGFEYPEDVSDTENTMVSLYVLDSTYVINGEEDYTHVRLASFGENEYMCELVSRIEDAKENK